MEIKFTVAGPPIGGGKSGINFDPRDPRKKEVLQIKKRLLQLNIQQEERKTK